MAPLKEEECTIPPEPVKVSMPLMSGMFFSPEWPVAWMMCFGRTVLDSTMPGSFSISSFTVQRDSVSDQVALLMVVDVQTLSSSNLAYDSKKSASLSLGVKTGQ